MGAFRAMFPWRLLSGQPSKILDTLRMCALSWSRHLPPCGMKDAEDRRRELIDMGEHDIRHRRNSERRLVNVYLKEK